MHSDGPFQDPDELRSLGYERRDVSYKRLVVYLGMLFVFVGVASGVVMLAYPLAVRQSAGPAGRPPGSAEAKLPPQPRVQGYPTMDMQHFRAWEDAQLTSYAWRDKAHGVVRIPVDHALDIVATRLPVAPPGNAGQAALAPAGSVTGSTVSAAAVQRSTGE